MIVNSVLFLDFQPKTQHFNSISISLSVLVFAASLIITGFRFSETANKHRECYLRLQALEGKLNGCPDPEREYAEILSIFPNHWTMDYDRLLIERTFLRGDKIYVGSEIKIWHFYSLYSYASNILAFWGLALGVPAIATALLVLTFF
jgi:hypothetical protein